MAEEAPRYGRSSSALRALYETLNFERSSSSQGLTKKNTKAASDKLVWFAPVPSPLLSPAREKNLKVVKKKVRQKSIFSIQNNRAGGDGKGAIESVEEPTSPKVSCIGQVRSNRKNRDHVSECGMSKPQQGNSNGGKHGSSSPARFFMSPGRQAKWGNIFGSRKVSSNNGSASGCHSYVEDNNKQDKQSIWSAAFRSSREGGSYTNSSDNGSYDIHLYEDTQQRSSSYDSISNFYGKDDDASQSCTTSTSDIRSLSQRQEETATVNRKSTYEELPSLHCGASDNLKISLEVVPETWLWRDGERLTVDGAKSMPQRSQGSSHGEPASRPTEEDGYIALSHEEVSTVSDARNCRCSQDHQVEECVSSISTGDITCQSLKATDDSCSHLSRETKSTHSDHRNISLKKTETRSFDNPEDSQTCSGQTHIQDNLVYQQKLRGTEPPHPILVSSQVNKNIHSLNPLQEDVKYSSGTCKTKKREAFTTKPFSALILVGYNLNDQSVALKDAKDNIGCGEECLKGTVEVGRLSFHGKGSYLHFLKGEAEFIRSRSATSHRTVIRLQRCNSEPWKPSK